jgi:hypothetical protein
MTNNACLITVKMSKSHNITLKRSEKLISYAESIGVRDYVLINENWITPKQKLSLDQLEEFEILIDKNPKYNLILCHDYKWLFSNPDYFNKFVQFLQRKKVQMLFAATSDNLFNEGFGLNPTYQELFNSIK